MAAARTGALFRRGFVQQKIGDIFTICQWICTKRGIAASTTWANLHHQLRSHSSSSCQNIVSSRSFASKAKPRKLPIDSNKFSEQPIIFVSATYNNTMLTLTDHKGNTLAWSSAGSEGYKNSKRGSSVAAQQASVSLAKKASDFGIQKVRVKVKGIGNGRQASVKSLSSAGLKIVSITDVTPIPHNGCRPKKARRI